MQIYSVDTSFFYTKKEMEIEKEMSLIRFEKKQSKNKDINKELNKKLNNNKEKLKKEFKNFSNIREMDYERLRSKHTISIFESFLTRVCGMETNKFSDKLIVVQVYFFEVLESLIKKGFILNGKKYIFYSSSAGQIRTKKAVFIEEETFKKNKNTIMCGLTIDDINNSKYAGMNVNKFLVYLALSNTASDHWPKFNIDKSIVVNDLETELTGLVDHIDRDTFNIERIEKNVSITHTDGCGIILPSVNKKSFMVRLPWIKGLLTPFDFKKFIKETNGTNPIIKDIYGQEHDVIKEGIEVIFTKSQFKMWKYYQSWDQYKENFKKYSCEASICNEEEERFSDAKLNYQMIQTLHKISDEELKSLAQDTIDYISSIGQGKDNMLKSMGIHKYNKQKTELQQAIELYPALLREYSTKETIKEIKKSAVRQARSGRIVIKGKYTFLIPDMYAFCEYLFKGDTKPKGLLNDKEVFCKIYKKSKELDCLRSPHLSCEHAIRNNTINSETEKWFTTDGLYTSTHDFISKILMFDNDGDTCLVTGEPVLVKSAKEHMRNVVPLDYEMEVAKEQNLNSDTLYKGLITAFTGGNIGEISNGISKIWNSDEPNLDAVKWMTALNNYVIDFAKTLYKPEIPVEKREELEKFTKNKLPNFFKYAKLKEEDQVADPNNSAMNRLGSLIPDTRIRFDMKDVPNFNHKNLLHYKNQIIRDVRVEQVYEAFNYSKRFSNINKNNLHEYQELFEDLKKIHEDENYVSDALINYLFIEKKQSKKETMWKIIGHIIVRNLKKNLNLERYCQNCGKEIESAQAKKYCDDCAKAIEKEKTKARVRKHRQNVTEIK